MPRTANLPPPFFVRADSKGVTGALRISAETKGVTGGQFRLKPGKTWCWLVTADSKGLRVSRRCKLLNHFGFASKLRRRTARTRSSHKENPAGTQLKAKMPPFGGIGTHVLTVLSAPYRTCLSIGLYVLEDQWVTATVVGTGRLARKSKSAVEKSRSLASGSAEAQPEVEM